MKNLPLAAVFNWYAGKCKCNCIAVVTEMYPEMCGQWDEDLNIYLAETLE